MAEDYILGRECKVFHNTATFATPTWDEILNVEVASPSREGSKADFDNRGLPSMQHKRGTLAHALELVLTWSRGTNADYEALRDALLNDTLIDLWVLDGDAVTAGHQGDRFEYTVLSESSDQPLAEGVKVTFTLAPGVTADTGGNKVAV